MGNVQKFLDLAGKKFNRLTAIEIYPTTTKEAKRWLCKCDCGKEKIVLRSNLTSGAVKSCGCIRFGARPNRATHYKTKSRVYSIWHHMLERVSNPKHVNYHRYGGRGITVCEEWRKFKNFYKDMGDPVSDNHTLDRIENDKGYYKDNCRWATAAEQGINRSNSIVFEYNGQLLSRNALCKQIRVAQTTFIKQINKGLTVEEIIDIYVNKPSKNQNKQAAILPESKANFLFRQVIAKPS